MDQRERVLVVTGEGTDAATPDRCVLVVALELTRKTVPDVLGEITNLAEPRRWRRCGSGVTRRRSPPTRCRSRLLRPSTDTSTEEARVRSRGERPAARGRGPLVEDSRCRRRRVADPADLAHRRRPGALPRGRSPSRRRGSPIVPRSWPRSRRRPRRHPGDRHGAVPAPGDPRPFVASRSIRGDADRGRQPDDHCARHTHSRSVHDARFSRGPRRFR